MTDTNDLLERIQDYIRVGRNRGWNEYADDLEALAARLRDAEEALGKARPLLKLFSGTLPERGGRVLAQEWVDKYGE